MLVNLRFKLNFVREIYKYFKILLWRFLQESLYVVRCAIWYHLYNVKNLNNFVKFKNTHGGVLVLVKVQAESCSFTKSKTPPLVFLIFLKLYKWYQSHLILIFVAIVFRVSCQLSSHFDPFFHFYLLLSLVVLYMQGSKCCH